MDYRDVGNIRRVFYLIHSMKLVMKIEENLRIQVLKLESRNQSGSGSHDTEEQFRKFRMDCENMKMNA